jgi:hypothetical protein
VKEDDSLEVITWFVEETIGSEIWTIGFDGGGERVTITPRASRAFGRPPAVLSGTSAAASQPVGVRGGSATGPRSVRRRLPYERVENVSPAEPA